VSYTGSWEPLVKFCACFFVISNNTTYFPKLSPKTKLMNHDIKVTVSFLDMSVIVSFSQNVVMMIPWVL
jgi:hypothetical protein